MGDQIHNVRPAGIRAAAHMKADERDTELLRVLASRTLYFAFLSIHILPHSSGTGDTTCTCRSAAADTWSQSA